MTMNPESTVLDRVQALLDDPQVEDVALTVSGPVRLRMVDGSVREHPPIAHTPHDRLILARFITGAGEAP